LKKILLYESVHKKLLNVFCLGFDLFLTWQFGFF